MLPCSPVTASEAFGYMLERPRIPRYSSTQVGSENAPGADNQQERPESRPAIWESSETARRTPRTPSTDVRDDDTVRALRRRREAGRNARPPRTTLPSRDGRDRLRQRPRATRRNTQNGGVQRYPQPGWQSGIERKGIRVLDCESDGTSRDESRP